MKDYSLRLIVKRLGEETYHKALFDHIKNTVFVLGLATVTFRYLFEHVIHVAGKWLTASMLLAILLGLISLFLYNLMYFIKNFIIPISKIEKSTKPHVKLKHGTSRSQWTRLRGRLSRVIRRAPILAVAVCIWSIEVYAFNSTIDAITPLNGLNTARPANAAASHRAASSSEGTTG